MTKNSFTLLYLKGATAYCPNCGEKAATFTRDLFLEEVASAPPPPAPFLNDGAGFPNCVHCGVQWFLSGKYLNLDPNTDTVKILRGDYEIIVERSETLIGRSGRQSTFIANLADEFHYKSQTVGLTPFEDRAFKSLQKFFNEEIEIMKSIKEELLKGKQ